MEYLQGEVHQAAPLKPGTFCNFGEKKKTKSRLLPGWERRLEGPVAVASPGWTGPRPQGAGGESYGGVADGSGCWTPALGRESEETQGMKSQRFRETWVSPGILSLKLFPPEIRGAKKPTDLGHLLNLHMPRSPIP